jgi:hypothetical protein
MFNEVFYLPLYLSLWVILWKVLKEAGFPTTFYRAFVKLTGDSIVKANFNKTLHVIFLFCVQVFESLADRQANMSPGCTASWLVILILAMAH